MNLNDLLRLPAHKLGSMTYDEYALLLTDVITHRQMLASIQKRETNANLYASRFKTIEKINALKHALSMHHYYDRYCEQLITRVPQPVAA